MPQIKLVVANYKSGIKGWILVVPSTLPPCYMVNHYCIPLDTYIENHTLVVADLTELLSRFFAPFFELKYKINTFKKCSPPQTIGRNCRVIIHITIWMLHLARLKNNLPFYKPYSYHQHIVSLLYANQCEDYNSTVRRESA